MSLRTRPRRFEPRSVADAYSRGTANSIGFLRWVFASMVIFYHGYILAAFAANPIGAHLKIPLGGFAVLCFFVLSGFLVARSYATSSGFVDFLWKRILRIFPGYWLCLLVTICVFGPLSWRHNHGTWAGYHQARPWQYFTQNKWLVQNHSVIPGVFLDTKANQVIHLHTTNGSLWTLRYEFYAYLVVGVIGLGGILWKRRAAVLALTGFLGVAVLAQSVAQALDPKNRAIGRALGAIVQPLADPNLGRLLFAFLVGTCFALYAEKIVLDDRIGWFSIGAILLTARWGGQIGIIGAAAITYMVLWLGARLPFTWWDRIGDSSYGVYVYGWPVEVLLAERGVHRVIGLQAYLALSILVSTAIGLVSWHLVEKQALKLKRIDPYQFVLTRWKARSQRPAPDLAAAGEPTWTNPEPARGQVAAELG